MADNFHQAADVNLCREAREEEEEEGGGMEFRSTCGPETLNTCCLACLCVCVVCVGVCARVCVSHVCVCDFVVAHSCTMQSVSCMHIQQLTQLDAYMVEFYSQLIFILQ